MGLSPWLAGWRSGDRSGLQRIRPYQARNFLQENASTESITLQARDFMANYFIDRPVFAWACQL